MDSLPLLLGVPREKLPQTIQPVLDAPAENGVKYYPFRKPTMSRAVGNAIVVGAPALAMMIWLLIPVFSRPVPIAQLLCMALAVVLCFWVLFGQVVRVRYAWLVRKRWMSGIQRGGVYIGERYALFYFSSKRIDLLPRDQIIEAQEARVCFVKKNETYVQEMTRLSFRDRDPVLIRDLPVEGGFQVEQLLARWGIQRAPGRVDVTDADRRQHLAIGNI
ncbi:MAG: hypothetical protein AAFV53_25460 [Myxococcota bacterium]